MKKETKLLLFALVCCLVILSTHPAITKKGDITMLNCTATIGGDAKVTITNNTAKEKEVDVSIRIYDRNGNVLTPALDLPEDKFDANSSKTVSVGPIPRSAKGGYVVFRIRYWGCPEIMEEQAALAVRIVTDEEGWFEDECRVNIGGDPPIYQNIMVFPTPERYHGSDLNNNGKTNDTVLRYQNVETGEVINTGLIASGAHHAIDIYEDVIVFVGEESRICYYDINTGTVSEVGVAGFYPSIYGHIIAFDSQGTIHYYNLDTGALVDTNVKGHSPTLYQDVIVFCAGQKSTIWTYDLGTGTAVDTGIVGKNPALYETVIAFETSEAAVAEDLNGDGDTSDSVIRYCDLTTGIVHNTEMVGFYPAIYRNRIAFTTPERCVYQDLNEDGKIMGNIIHYCDVKTGLIVNTQQLGTEPDIYDNTITFYLLEQWVDQDLNRDGDQSDPIVGTSRITVTKMAIAGPETWLFLILAAIGGITAYFKRKN